MGLLSGVVVPAPPPTQVCVLPLKDSKAEHMLGLTLATGLPLGKLY